MSIDIKKRGYETYKSKGLYYKGRFKPHRYIANSLSSSIWLGLKIDRELRIAINPIKSIREKI